MQASATAKSDTKSLIMDTAERMIAEHGLNGVSNRAILSEAGVNSAALHYHFNSREGLIEAIVVRYGRIPTKRRLQMIRELENAGHSPSLQEIVDVLVDPMVFLLEEKGEAGRRFLRFLARLHSDRTTLDRDVEYKYNPEISARLRAWTRAACPGISEDERQLRVTMVANTMLQTLSSADFMAEEWGSDEPDAQLERFVAQLKAFLVAGLAAPPAEV